MLHEDPHEEAMYKGETIEEVIAKTPPLFSNITFISWWGRSATEPGFP